MVKNMSRPNVNVAIGGIPKSTDYIYNTVVLKNNLSFASQVEANNTRYVIRWNYDLEGENVEIPENCILEFLGGYLKNGTLVGNYTQIIASQSAIFSNIAIQGTWNVPDIYSAWFSNVFDDNVSRQLMNLTDVNISNRVVFENGIFNVSVSSNKEAVFSPTSNTEIVLLGTIKLAVNDFKYYFIFDINNVSNVKIVGTGSIEGDYSGDFSNPGHPYNGTGDLEHGFGVRITNGSKNCVLDGIEISNCAGDGVYVGGMGVYDGNTEITPESEQISIRNVVIHDNSRQGISATNVSSFEVTGCTIYNVQAVSPGAGVDLEPNVGNIVKNVTISNNNIYDCYYGVTTNYKGSGVEIFNVSILSNNLNGSKGGMSFQEVENITIANNHITSSGDFTVRGKSALNNCSISSNEIINTRSTFSPEEAAEKSSIAAVFIVSSKTVSVSGNKISTEAIPAFIMVGTGQYIEGNNVSAPYVFHTKWNIDAGVIFNNVFTGQCSMLTRKACVIQGNTFNPASDLGLSTSMNYLYIKGDSFSVMNNNINIPLEISYDENLDTTRYVENNYFNIAVEGKYNSNNRIIFLRGTCFEGNTVNISKVNTGVEVSVLAGTGKSTYKRNKVVNATGQTIRDCFTANSSGSGTIFTVDSNTIVGSFTNEYTPNRFFNFSFDNVQSRGTDAPALSELEVGCSFYNASLGKPVWWNGTNWIDATGNRASYAIQYELTNITASNVNEPTADVPYTTKLSVGSQYSLPSTIQVTMDNVPLVAGTDYSYNQSTGDVIVGVAGVSGVTGDVVIAATGIHN